jgi:hypothetical protein
MQCKKPGGLPGFFGRGRYIVESRNRVDYMDMGKIVKARRRRNVISRPFYLCVDMSFGMSKQVPGVIV